jgi:hypothetical protein
MEDTDDDPDIGIESRGVNPSISASYVSSGSPARFERKGLKELVAYLIQPEDSTDDGRICEGDRGAYESRTLLGTIKPFMWIAAGIVMSLLAAQLQ